MRNLGKTLLAISAAAGLILSGCGGGGGSGGSTQTAATPQATPNALFQVGAAVVNVDPTAQVFAGGYGNTTTTLQNSNDPLQVRAFVVAKGNKAVAFAVVDSTGWFAEYQGAMAGNGQYGARVDAAAALASHGFSVDRTDVMVSTTHSHATPTMVGIWGPMTANNQAYVKQVHDAVVQAVNQAASNLKTSELWFANGNISSIIWHNGSGTDVVDGFSVDAKMPVLWARDPATGATNALYVNIPNHPDTFRPFNGSVTQGFSADVPGYVRATMDASVGGVAVVASGTLGRQEAPGKNSDYSEVAHQGDYVNSALRLAMANAKPLTSDTLAGAETAIQVSVGNSTTNPTYYQYNAGLLTLMELNDPTAGTGPTCFTSTSPGGLNAFNGKCTIPRALASSTAKDNSTTAWCSGNCTTPGASGATSLTTYTTALRIGPLLYVSNPGESFAEVNDAIRSGVVDAQSVNVVGLAGDFLGYNWSLSDYTVQQFTSSDFGSYNVGPDLAQKTADSGYANASKLGFQVAAAPATVKATSDPATGVVADPLGIKLPGIQFYPSQVESVASAITFYGSTTQPQFNYGKSSDTLSEISWNFGDGKQLVSTAGNYLDHTFVAPGSYNVTATVTDTNTGSKRSWSQSVMIDSPLTLTVKTPSGGAPSVAAQGGQGTLISATWTCADGSYVMGMTSSCANNAVLGVSAIDGAGNTAQTSLALH